MAEEPTTPDLVELSRRAFEASNRRDYDEAVAPYSEHAVWDMSQVGLGVFEGREAIRRFFDEWIGAYEEWHTTIEEFLDLGNRVTFGILHQRARPAGSSGIVELRYAAVTTWADGLVEWVTTYTDIDEARAAAERLAEERG